MRLLKPALFFLLIGFSGRLVALTPPLDPSEMEAEAKLIVRGKILRVECLSQKEETFHCGTQVHYRATLIVDRLLKKPQDFKATKTIPLRFTHYEYQRGCTGDQDHFHLPGEEGTYYLMPSQGEWKPLNWSAVLTEKKGEIDQVPQCPLKKGDH